MRRTIFVTVGTTLFEKLVQSVTNVEALEWMHRNGYKELIVQFGKGVRPIIDASVLADKKISVDLYDFKPSLAGDMAKADLVISHAGAGTVSEVLQLKRPRLVVVVNTLLMDNHQLELAHAMQRRKYLYVVDCPDRMSDFAVWDEFEKFIPRPQHPTDQGSFSRILGSFFSFDTDRSSDGKGSHKSCSDD
ncbi:hypothetical protein ACA910_000201 [Epithemia clementina (nom. ined.)]